MTERQRSTIVDAPASPSPKMEHDLGPRKTMIVLVIVVGCFAVLWPKVFYPMLVGSANQHIKPSPIDKTSGCCDVISETDVNTIKIMSELCGTIINGTDSKPLTSKEIQKCRQEVLETCGIDISAVLQEQVRLGQTVKQIIDEVRSLNGSLCLKYNFGLAPWRLGVPHRLAPKSASDPTNIRQERPMNLRAELVHPAFKERGRAIPKPQITTPSRSPPRIVEGRPGPIPGMRPTIGGAGHVVPPSKQGTSSMSVIMPVYTIGIVIFFTYTLMKIIFKKQPENVGASIYPAIDPDPHFRAEVFESESSRLGSKLTRDNVNNSKLVVNAMSALLDEVDQEIEARRKSSEVFSQDVVTGNLSNGDAVKPQDDEHPTVKVLGMEMTASCEGGKKWSRPGSPVLPTSPALSQAEPVPPPQEIYLEGALPAQSQLLVAESATEPESTTGEDPAVVLSGKMTLSVISLDSENGAEETKLSTDNGIDHQVHELLPSVTKEIHNDSPQEDVVETNKYENFLIENEKKANSYEEHSEQPIVQFEENQQSSTIEKDIKEFLESLQAQHDFQTPSITLESEDHPENVEVETLEREVDDLIQEAIESIREITTEPALNPENTNEIQTQDKIEERILESSDKILEIKKEDLNVSNDLALISTEPQNGVQTASHILEVDTTTPQVPIVDTDQQNPVDDKISGSLTAELFSAITDTVKPLDLENLAVIQPDSQVKTDQKEEQVAATGESNIKNPVSDKEIIENLADSQINTNQKEEHSITEVAVTDESKIRNPEEEELVSDEEIIKNLADSQVKTNQKEEHIVTEVASTVESKITNPEEEEELVSDEEIIEEIEEIVYEDDDEEEEVEVETEEEVLIDTVTNRADSSSTERFNGEQSEDHVEESKYTTASGATAAENDISDDELTDEDVEEEEEEEEIIEVEEIEDELYLNDEEVNHISEESDQEL